jgi:glutamyl-tRNA reductase
MDRVIGLIGLNFESAPVHIREQMHFTEEQIHVFVRSLKQLDPVAGCVVLSTCNRTEIYFHIKGKSIDEGFSYMLDKITGYKNLDKKIKKYLYYKHGYETVNHLFLVAAGLNSMIIGEDQIIGQVKNAFLLSDHEHCVGPVLTRLFNRSFQAGKHVRSETHINEGSASVSTAAVTLAKNQFKNLNDQHILLIGAGQTGQLAMQSLLSRGCDNITITNRTSERAEELEKKYNVKAASFSMLADQLIENDIVIVATGATKPLITEKIMLDVLSERNNRPITIIDISVPRNVEKEVENLEFVTLYDVDDTEVVIKGTIEKRKEEIKKAKDIVAELANDYMDWLASLNLSPTIRQIQENFLRVHDTEFNNYLGLKNGEDREPFKEYGMHISKKFSRLLIQNLKELTNNGKNVEYLNAFNELFELKIADEK